MTQRLPIPGVTQATGELSGGSAEHPILRLTAVDLSSVH